jgi:hypothetical protein
MSVKSEVGQRFGQTSDAAGDPASVAIRIWSFERQDMNLHFSLSVCTSKRADSPFRIDPVAILERAMFLIETVWNKLLRLATETRRQKN